MTQLNKRLTAGRKRAVSPKQASARRAPIDQLLDPALFKALCDPTRVSLLACLLKCGRACTVSEVAECCSVDFSVVSRHLAMLEQAGALESAKTGRTVSYKVRRADLTKTLRTLADAVEGCCMNPNDEPRDSGTCSSC
ncbi:MAG: winged helix-turn-helix transcriptional regulator [Planctomycetes bacterium]|nr:winged helix-turn-helix transcriptional regulator [Planctomycetota bacterium]